jgi:hypothetical protein
MEVNGKFEALAATSGERGWVSPGASLDAVEKGIISLHCQKSNPDSSAVKPIVSCCTDCLNEQVMD